MNTTLSEPSLTISGQGEHLQATAGCITLLRGEVGSGKTMWLERMAGLRGTPTGITIKLDNRNSQPDKTVRMLFDRFPAVWLGQSIAEELCFGLSALPEPSLLRQSLKTWGIEELELDHDVQQLNRLQGIRLALAAMELAAPDIVLLDNPSDCLPSSSAADLIGDIQDWVQRSNCIMVAACNRWQDWQDVAAQVWLTTSPETMLCNSFEEPSA